MESVLGGGLENSLIRQVTVEGDPTRLAITHPYYRSLQRRQPENMYKRAATILTISNRTHLPTVDWATTMGSSSMPSAEQFGWEMVQHSNMWEPTWTAFVEFAYGSGAFSDEMLAHLHGVDPVPGQIDDPQVLKDFAVHHVVRLLLQVEASAAGSSRLFLPKVDQQVIEELAAFATRENIAPPFDLPDFSACLNDPEGRSVTLLAYEPPDVISMISAREDKMVRHYAEAVQDLWAITDPVDRERRAVRAMRAVLDEAGALAQASSAFQTIGWGLKPLSWVGVPFAGAVADARDVGQARLDRHREKRDWLLIRTRMQDISLRDYLRRTDNF